MTRKPLYITFLALIVSFVWFQFANAAALYYQSDYSYVYGDTSNECNGSYCVAGTWQTKIGTGLTGTITSVIFWQANSYNAQHYNKPAKITIVDYPSVDYTGSPSYIVSNDSAGNLTSTLTQYNLGFYNGGLNHIVLNPAHSYAIISADFPSGATEYVAAGTSSGTCQIIGGCTAGFNAMYYILTDNGDGTITPPNTDFTTRIDWLSPPKTQPSATTTSSTINFHWKYYFNSASSSIATYPDIQLQLCPMSYPDEQCQQITVATSTVADAYTDITKTITTNEVGYYLGIISFWNGVQNTTTCDWWNPFCHAQTVQVLTPSSNYFNVATTTLPVKLPITKQDIMSTCDDSILGTQTICKALVYLFMPDSTAFNQFGDMTALAATKIPFSYFYQMQTIFNAVSVGTGTSTLSVSLNSGHDFNLGTMDIVDFSQIPTFKSYMDTIVSWVLWVLFGAYCLWRAIGLIEPKNVI